DPHGSTLAARGLREELACALGKNSGIISRGFFEQLVKGSGMDGAEGDVPFIVKELDGKMGGAGITLERPLPQLGTEDLVTRRYLHAERLPRYPGRGAQARATPGRHRWKTAA